MRIDVLIIWVNPIEQLRLHCKEKYKDWVLIEYDNNSYIDYSYELPILIKDNNFMNYEIVIVNNKLFHMTDNWDDINLFTNWVKENIKEWDLFYKALCHI